MARRNSPAPPVPECSANLGRVTSPKKNSAAAKASQPWILGLDADEAVSAP